MKNSITAQQAVQAVSAIRDSAEKMPLQTIGKEWLTDPGAESERQAAQGETYRAEMLSGYTEDDPHTYTATGNSEAESLLNLGLQLAKEFPLDNDFFDACACVLSGVTGPDGWQERVDFSTPESNFKLRVVRVEGAR